MFEDQYLFETIVVILVVSVLWMLNAILTNLRDMHQEQLNEAKRQKVYLEYILLHMSVSNSELSSDRKERFHHAMEADLKAVGLNGDEAMQVYEESAKLWRDLHGENE